MSRLATASAIAILSTLVAVGASSGGLRVARTASLAATPTSLVYGDDTLLQATLPAGVGKVSVFAKACGFTAFGEIGQAAAPGGNARYRLSPARQTAFYLKWDTGRTGTVSVRVAPLVEVRKVGGYAVARVTVGAGEFFVGRPIVIERQSGKQWKAVARGVMKRVSHLTALDAVSGASIRVAIPAGSSVRASVPAASVAPCYAAATSKPVRF